VQNFVAYHIKKAGYISSLIFISAGGKKMLYPELTAKSIY
jgi:hypothetical protein